MQYMSRPPSPERDMEFLVPHVLSILQYLSHYVSLFIFQSVCLYCEIFESKTVSFAFFFFFCFLKAILAAYGGSQAKGQIRAADNSLCSGSEPCL